MKFYEQSEYEEKVNSIFELLKRDLLENKISSRVEHIGASSISGSVSKGDLDVFVGVEKENFNHALEGIKELGFYEKEDTLRTDELCMLVTDKYNHDVAIQLVVNGSEFEYFISFRDFMRAHPKLVEELNQLKRDCAGLESDDYRSVKSKWVEKIIKQYICNK
jgi:GrpB-like predicted nucleotidyltransferase (UPF0157 family)